MISPSADPIGAGAIETMAEIGFDYVELSLADMASLPEHLFADLARRIEQAGIRCESCNNFFPRAIRLTGAEARLEAALEYARPALDRAARLGVEVIVFGSSGAKNVPRGFPVQDAWKQIVDLLGHLGPAAAQHEVTIVIEPINRLESNLVTLASQGLRLAREVGHPNIQLLIDFYHLKMEREDPGIIVEAGAAVRHLHFAQVEGRRFPTEWDASEYSGFFEAIRKIHYAGRCSIEAYTDDFPADARRGLTFLKLASGQ
jgi:sugar phosphate isomerase/epimerase